MCLVFVQNGAYRDVYRERKGAEVVERKWDGLRSRGRKCARTRQECGFGGARMELLGWGCDVFGRTWSALCSSAALPD